MTGVAGEVWVAVQNGSHLITKIVLCYSHSFDEPSHGTQIIKLSAYLEWFPTYLFLRPPNNQFSNHAPLKSLTIQSNHWLQFINCIDLYIASSLLPGKMNSQEHCLKFYLLGGFSSTTVLQGHPRVGLFCCSCFLLGHACMSHSTIYKTSPRFFFLSQMAR